MHIYAAKLPVQQSPVIAKVGTNNLMIIPLIHIVHGMNAKNSVSQTLYTHVHVTYRQPLETLCSCFPVLFLQMLYEVLYWHATVHSSICLVCSLGKSFR